MKHYTQMLAGWEFGDFLSLPSGHYLLQHLIIAKSLSQAWERDFEVLLPFSQFWEKGLGDEGDLQKWDTPNKLSIHSCSYRLQRQRVKSD
jgi:hypothetical protein